MEYIDLVTNIGFILIAVGMWKLGRQDPKGFLYQAGGAFTMVAAGFFMRDAGTVITCWNVVFGLIGLVGYRRLRNQ